MLASLTLAQAQSNSTISLEFLELPLPVFVRVVYGDALGLSYVLHPEITRVVGSVSISVRHLTPAALREVADSVLASQGLSASSTAGVLMLAKSRTDPLTEFVYKPQYRTAKFLSEALRPFVAGRSSLAVTPTLGAVGLPVGAQAAAPVAPAAADADIVLLQIPLADVPKITRLLAQIDTRAPEVRIKAAVYEVSNDQRDGSAIKFVTSLLKGKLGITFGQQLSATGGTVTYKADSFDAVITFLNTRSDFRLVSSPTLRVRDRATARLVVGDEVPTLGAVSQDRNGNNVQSIEYRSSGVILELKPVVSDKLVELSVKQQISSFGSTTTGVNGSPTLSKREVTTEVLAEHGDLVMLAGLEQERTTDDSLRLPFVLWPVAKDAQKRRVEVVVLLDVSIDR